MSRPLFLHVLRVKSRGQETGVDVSGIVPTGNCWWTTVTPSTGPGTRSSTGSTSTYFGWTTRWPNRRGDRSMPGHVDSGFSSHQSFERFLVTVVRVIDLSPFRTETKKT